MRLISILILLATSIFLPLGTGFGSEEVLVLTEEYPPRNFEENGEIKGLSVELVREMFGRAGLSYDLRLIMWKDGYRMAKEKPGVGLFSTTRTKQRENLFHWIGPLDSQYLGFWAKKEAELKMENIEDAKKVRRIGTYKDDVMEQLLLEKGFRNLESVSSQVLNLKKLMAGRIDMAASEKIEFILLAQKQGVDPNELEFIHSLDKSDLYLVFSKSTPLSLVNKLNRAFDEMKKDGFLKRTTQKWYGN